MSAQANVRAVLEIAGADPHAPEGSIAWALAQADAAVASLIAERDALLAKVEQQPAPAHVSEVTRQLIERDSRGRAKYGTSLDHTDLSLADWLQHMAEELLDAAGYALAAKRTAQHQPAPVVDDAMVARLAVWMAERDGHDDPHHLIWEGNPPEPWGEVWNRYVGDARSALTAALASAQGVQS